MGDVSGHCCTATLVKLRPLALLSVVFGICGMLATALAQPPAASQTPDEAGPGEPAVERSSEPLPPAETIDEQQAEATPDEEATEQSDDEPLIETLDDELAADPAVPAPVPLPVGWFETRIAIEELAESGDFEGALELRDHLFTLAAAEFGEPSPQLAEAHRLIAGVHRQSGDFTEAEVEILEAIEVYESGSGPLSPELIEPYVELGDNYSEAGDFAAALSSYGEARTIGRRHYGLLNEDQIAIIDEMSAAAESLEQLEEAAGLQLEALEIVERNHGEASLEAIDAKYRYARWLREHSLHEDALHIYYQIEDIIGDSYNKDPLMTVRLLRERSKSVRVPEGDTAMGGMQRSSLAEALEILEAMPDPPPLLLAEVLVEKGDWDVKYSRARLPSEDYVRAWDLLGQIENGVDLRRQWFEELVVIDMPPLSRRNLTEDPDAPDGFVEVFFTVDILGHTQDIEITASEPRGLKDLSVEQVIRGARFRPRIVEGEIVAVRRGYRFPFKYVPQAEEP